MYSHIRKTQWGAYYYSLHLCLSSISGRSFSLFYRLTVAVSLLTIRPKISSSSSLSLSFYVCTYPEEPEDKQAMERNEKEGAIVMLGEGTEGLDWTLTGDVFHPDVISVREALPVERKISKGFRRDCAFTTQTHTAAGNIP